MPTGGGKSLLYQLPAYIENGFSIVVSPLELLIDDQIRIMKEIKFNAVTINSYTFTPAKERIFSQMLDDKSDLNLIYVSLDWLARNETFLNQLQKAEKVGRFKRIVIDEVHCCSKLGHNYRRGYQYLGKLRTIFPKIPFLGLTATATMDVLMDIQKELSMQNSMVITASLNRPNLYHRIIYKSPIRDESINQICNLLENYSNQRGIIYCNTKRKSINLTRELTSRGYKCRCYHVEMYCDGHTERVYNEWVNKQSLIIIASEAFDIGIDMPDVRFVIHYCMPRSIANLYQQTGRAGRDGQRADCIIMHNLYDYLNAAKQLHDSQEKKNFLEVLDYCLTDYRCKRKLMLNYFDEDWHQDQCKQMCDYCEQSLETNLIDITNYYNRIYKILSDAPNKKLKLCMLLDTWLEGRYKPKLSRDNAQYVIARLISQKYLDISVHQRLMDEYYIYHIKLGEKIVDKKIIIKTTRIFNSTRKRHNYETRSAKKMKS